MSGRRSTHLVAYAKIAAASTNIPASGSWLQLTLLDPNGNAITGNTLPGQCTMVQFSGVGYVLGIDSSSVPAWQVIADAQPQALDVVLGGAGKKVAVSSENATAISTGNFAVYFYA